MKNQTERIHSLLKILNDGLCEREEIIAVSLLAAMAGQNIFFYGPPGTAKSLISRRLSKVFQTNVYFEHLMNRFSTPEEVFGPISIAELKKDNYVRRIEGFLPAADFAFLDEIWKSGPAILNTLLTVINEKIFKNGVSICRVPLKVLIAASNETPPENQGLDALFDRFLVRLHVPPVYAQSNFEAILQNGSSDDKLNVPEELKITNEELKEWSKAINGIRLSEDSFNIIHIIKLEIDRRNGKSPDNPFIYVSDRRWQRAAYLMKANALFCGRAETNTADCLLLPYCLWTKNTNREEIFKITEMAIRENGLTTNISLAELDNKKAKLESELNALLYYKEDIYKTVTLSDGNDYFEYLEKYPEEYYHGSNEKINFFIPVSKLHSPSKFLAVDINGNEHKNIECQFDKQGWCRVQLKIQQRWNSAGFWSTYTMDLEPFKPEILFQKGDKKQINGEASEYLSQLASGLIEELNSALSETEAKKAELLKTMATPFLLPEKLHIAVEGIDKQLDDIAFRIKECRRLREAATA